MTSLAKLSPKDAPRDLAALVKLGRFQLRTLATELGMLNIEETKMDFVTQSQEKQAQAVFEALKEIDKGGTPAPIAPAQTEAAKPKRTPKTSEETPEPANGGGSSKQVAKLTEMVEELQGGLLEANKGLVALTRLVSASISLTLLASEQSLGAGRQEILAAALEDAAGVAKQITDALGKAKGK